MATQEFEAQLVSFMPKMRTWALALTRNGAAADDLTQDVATKALAASEAFEPGTNFGGWVHRIMRNHFISSIRSQRKMVDVEDIIEQGEEPTHETKIALKELSGAVNRLPPTLRKAFLMIVVDEDSYEAISERTGCAVGTLKSRVHRARLQLRAVAA